MNNVNTRQDPELAKIRRTLRETERQLALREAQWAELTQSRGYRMLLKYYKLRDILLPQHSIRRLLLVVSIRLISNIPTFWHLLTVYNIKKAIYYVRRGGLSSVLGKLNSKLQSSNITGENQPQFSRVMAECLQKQTGYDAPSSEDSPVDIIIPVYNAYDYTKKCLEMVLQNTDSPYNLHVINDCSPDDRIRELLTELSHKIKPAKLKNLYISHNEENLGFVKTVNQGMERSLSHVVLLNTDTEVPPNWLSRLIRPVLEDSAIASVTPFSNNATICSFPDICQENELPYSLKVQEVDRFFSEYVPEQEIEIPTGVGFCMLLNRQSLDKIGFFDATTYGKGYGEENDWCMRAAQAGYRHVMIPNLFVYHKDGASFSQRTDQLREARIEENLVKLNQRYPHYGQLVEQFIRRDPLAAIRQVVGTAIFAAYSKKPGQLVIGNSLGGGTRYYQEKYIKQHEEVYRFYKLEYYADNLLLLTDCTQTPPQCFQLQQSDLTSFTFQRLLQFWNIDNLYINQLIEHSLFLLMDLIQACGKSYIYFIHDYYCVCPSYNLLDSEQHYCHAQTELIQCQKCLAAGLITEPWINLKAADIVIGDWRSQFRQFLQQADKVVAPSETTKQIVQKYYSEVLIQVQEHVLGNFLIPTFDPEWLQQPVLNVACIGAIGENKGLNILDELLSILRQEKLPIRLVVIGITTEQSLPYTSEDQKSIVTGPYDNSEISRILQEYQIAVVLIPSIWPETFSYTTSEAMQSGYPVITFSIGAPAERVKRYDGGWLVDEINAKGIASQLRQLLQDRTAIAKKAENLVQMNW